MKLSEFLQKHRLSEGDLVSVFTKSQSVLEGTIVPSNDERFLVLKLKNGYNAGVRIEEISSIKKIGEGKQVGKPPVQEVKKDSSKPTIAILHTGGTIASRVDYNSGAVFTSFEPEDLITMFPELKQTANFEARLVAQMWSEDMRFKHYELLAKEVEKEVKKPEIKGVIIGHGTDTLHYSAAALAFMLENCPKPVILVGAQRSSDRGSSDSAMNLICAAEFITNSDFQGIAVCMHENSSDNNCIILHPCKVRKLHSSRRDAFKPVNSQPIARVNYSDGKIEVLTPWEKPKWPFIVKEKIDEKVALLKLHPNFNHEQLEFFIEKKYNGLVLEGTGLGQGPFEAPNELAKPNLKNFEALKKLINQGCIVVMTSQCIFGRVHMHVYSKAVMLQKAGVIPGEDMLSETAFVKLAWLLGNYPKEKVKELMVKNLRGEITERTGYKEQEIEFKD